MTDSYEPYSIPLAFQSKNGSTWYQRVQYANSTCKQLQCSARCRVPSVRQHPLLMDGCTVIGKGIGVYQWYREQDLMRGQRLAVEVVIPGITRNVTRARTINFGYNNSTQYCY